MTAKTQTPYADALAVATALATDLAPSCKRIHIAGSIRRQCATVGDIELVCVPDTYAVATTLFDTTEHSRIDDWLYANDILPAKDGDRYKQFVWRGHQIDLFIADRTNYGYILALRTGPVDFSRALVTPAPYGLKPPTINVRDGYVYSYPANKRLLVPDEGTLFALWGIDYIAPQDRR